jgi:CRP-like cAMP-binding protein
VSLDAEIVQLRANPLFALFDAEALRLVAFSSDTRVLRPDDVLFREGEVSDGGYFIVSGSIALATGETEELCGPGALVGETALFTETQRPATAIVREATVVRRIPRHLMRRVLAAYPGAAMRIQAYLHEKVLSVGDSLARADALLMADDGEG